MKNFFVCKTIYSIVIVFMSILIIYESNNKKLRFYENNMFSILEDQKMV